MEVLTNPTAYTKHTTLASCQRQVEQKIKGEFHKLVGEAEENYRSFYQRLIEAAADSTSPQDFIISLVEPRIPFFIQTERLGIMRDPAVFMTPVRPCREPYFVWLKVLGKNDEIARQGLSTGHVIERLPRTLRPANPFEGISVWEEVLQTSFVNLPGGDIEKVPGLVEVAERTKSLCLDRYHGRARITHTYLSDFDGFVGTLVAYRRE